MTPCGVGLVIKAIDSRLFRISGIGHELFHELAPQQSRTCTRAYHRQSISAYAHWICTIKVCRRADTGWCSRDRGDPGKGSCWNKKEWLPILVANSKYLRNIPASLGPNDMVDWIPVDVLSKVLVDINPAISLLDFYGSLLSDSGYGNLGFETADTVQASKELARLEAVKPEWMKIWLEQWNF